MPTNYRFGGGAAETVLSPIVLVATILAVVLIFLMPRRFVVLPFLFICFLVPATQSLVVGGVHVFVARIAVLAAFSRFAAAKVTMKESLLAGGLNMIDKVFLCWALSRCAAFMILYGHTDAAVNQFGFLWDSLGGYFVLRFAIRDEDDIRIATKAFGLIAIMIAVSMVNEKLSKSNIFGLIGGRSVPDIRDGKVRSQGPFAHAILAGVFGATLLPLFLRLYSIGKERLLAAAGIVATAAIVITSASSTPLGAYAAGIIGMCFWPFRRIMRGIRWGIVFAILLLASFMKAPVWFLLARIDFVGGSSGYHRAMLIDQCIRRFGDWWLLGVSNNQNWGWDMWDVQNEFIVQALQGGLVALVLFVLLLTRSFGRLGNARRLVETDRRQAWLQWTLGAVMLAHVVAFFGADYFDQTKFWWFASLAIIGAATAPLLATKKRTPEADSIPSAAETAADPAFAFFQER